ncbi:hypothetical protein [Moorena sp. SIO4E2]|uniref:hypothetical protein n=1 Tax=Moorena sp. SIO4E2 TaxID=2607826 RepID=UPI00257CAC7A|nr:hypothetical protein [Moorena sp. SIO4E2]
MINNSFSVLNSQSNLQPMATTGDLDITNSSINVEPPIESQRIIDFDDIDQVFDLEIQPQDGTTANITKIEISSHRTVDPDDPLVKISSSATATNMISPNPLAKSHTNGTGDSGGGVVMVSSSSTATSTISDNPSADLSDRSDNTSEDLSIRVAWPKANPIVSIHGTAMVSSTISNPNTNNYQISGAATVTISEDIVGTITNPIDSLLDSFLTPSLFTPSLLTSSLGFPSSRIDLDQSRSRSVGL